MYLNFEFHLFYYIIFYFVIQFLIFRRAASIINMDGYVRQFCNSLKNCIEKSQYRTAVDKTQKFISRQVSSFQTFSRQTIIHLLYLESYCCHKIIIKALTQPQQYIDTYVVKETLKIILRNMQICYQCISAYLQSKQIIVNFQHKNKPNANQFENTLYKISEKSFGQFLQIVTLFMKDILLLLSLNKQHTQKDDIYFFAIQFLDSIKNILRKKKIRFRVNQLEINCLYVVYLFRSKQYKKGSKQCQKLLVEIFDFLSHLNHQLGLPGSSSLQKYKKALKKCYKLLLMTLLYQAFFHILCDQFRPIQSLTSIIKKIQTITGPKQLIKYYQSYNDIISILTTISKEYQQFEYHFGKGEVLSIEAIYSIIQNSQKTDGELNKNSFCVPHKFQFSQITKPAILMQSQNQTKIHFKTNNQYGHISKHSQQGSNNAMKNSKSMRTLKTQKSVKEVTISAAFQRDDHIIEGSRPISSSKTIINNLQKEKQNNFSSQPHKKSVCIKVSETYKGKKNRQEQSHGQSLKKKSTLQNQQQKIQETNFFMTLVNTYPKKIQNNTHSLHEQFKESRKNSKQNFTSKKRQSGFCALSLISQDNERINQIKINRELVSNQKKRKNFTPASLIANEQIVKLTQAIMQNNIKSSKLDLLRKKKMSTATLQLFNDSSTDKQRSRNFNKSWNKFRKKIDQENKKNILNLLSNNDFTKNSTQSYVRTSQTNLNKKYNLIQNRRIGMHSTHHNFNSKQKSERNWTTRNQKSNKNQNQKVTNSSYKLISAIMKNSDELAISGFKNQPYLQKFFKILIKSKSSLSIASYSTKLQSYLKRQENKRIQQMEKQKQVRENSIKFGFLKQSTNNNQQRNSIKIDKTLSITMPDWNQKTKSKQKTSGINETSKKKGILKFNKMKSCNIMLDQNEEAQKKSKTKIAFNDNDDEIELCLQQSNIKKSKPYQHRLLVEQQLQQTEERQIQADSLQFFIGQPIKSSKCLAKSSKLGHTTNKCIHNQEKQPKLQICSQSQLKSAKKNPHTFRQRSKYDKQNLKQSKIPNYMTKEEYALKLELCYRKSLETLQDVTRKVLLKKDQLNGANKNKQKKKMLRKSQAYYAY